jgi:phenylacetyl-CoA:acceptor oxidoreductase subunit 2
MELTFIPIQRQRVWGWPAIVNFTMGSTGAALFLFHFLTKGTARAVTTWIAPLLVILGLSVLALEAGKPLRARFLLKNVRNSWMSREALAGALFLLSSLVAGLSSLPVWHYFTALSAAAFLVCQAFIIYRCRAIPAWNTWEVVPFFLTSALVTGSGVSAFLSNLFGEVMPVTTILLLVLLLALNAVSWIAYLRMPRSEAFQVATLPLRSRSTRLLVADRLLPGILLAAFLISAGRNEPVAWLALGVAALGMVVGSAYERILLLRQCGYLREIGLPRPVHRSSFDSSAEQVAPRGAFNPLSR